MKYVLAVLVFLIALAVGLYVDIDLLFVGGITEVVHGLNQTPDNTSDIIWGIVRTLCTGFGFFVAILIGAAAWWLVDD